MTNLTLLSFFVALVYLYMGIYAFRQNMKSSLHRAFFALCVLLAFWAFTYTFVYSASNEATAWYWFRLSSWGWCMYAGVILHFFLILTNQNWILKQKWVYLFLYGPGLILVYQVFTGHVTAVEFLFDPRWGWYEIISLENPWFWVHLMNYTLAVTLGFTLVWIWGRKTKAINEKMQARIIVLSGVATLVLGSINVILLSSDLGLPSIPHAFGLIWAVGTWFAISKYEFMTLTEEIAAKEILKRVKDLLVLIDPQGKIIKVNKRTEDLLYFSEKELLGKPLGEIIADEGSVLQMLEILKNRSKSDALQDFEIKYRSKEGDVIPVNVSGSLIKNNWGRPLGVVLVAQDIRQTIQLQEEIVERKKAEDSIRHMAYHDPLTNLPNRKLFQERLIQEISRAQRKKEIIAVMFLDLDKFKIINDTYGHEIGDKVLCEIASRLSESVRISDTVCRMGGDEFLVLCTGIKHEDDVPIIADKIFAEFDKAVIIDNIKYEIKCSLGISISPWDGLTPDEIIKKADDAMYLAKKSGRDQYIINQN